MYRGIIELKNETSILCKSGLFANNTCCSLTALLIKTKIYFCCCSFANNRAYFRKKKRLGIRRFIKKCPFWKKKKKLFLIWIKSLKNNFQLGRILPLPAFLDNPSSLLSNKGDLLLQLRTLWLNRVEFDSILHFT